ncbi:MAG TPA: hypothetical protein VHV28_12650 [Solirubrobacteraceae bacterium]|jgi:hypothetical protein|nr:hypothetical protein [Solirubrobacteraceae bacterium]
MSPDETLLYESRVRSRQVAIAIVAGICLIVASIIQLTGPHTKVDELTLDLLVANQRFPLDLISSVINAIGSLAIAWTLLFLFGAARARNPDKARGYVRILTLVGGGLAATAGVIYAVVVAIKVHEFATTGSQTYTEANHLTTGAGLLGLQLVGQLAALLVAVAFVLVALTAMNQGLLSRFMGYLGMFAGALVLFQITQVPVVQTYWLLAIAYLISGRWPTGVPPAWHSGRSEPWPSSAEARARRAAGMGERRQRGGKKAQPAAEEPEPAAVAPVNERTRSATPKRKRKRRT